MEVVESLRHVRGFSFRKVECSYCGRWFAGVFYKCPVHGGAIYCRVSHIFLDGHVPHKSLEYVHH